MHQGKRGIFIGTAATMALIACAAPEVVPPRENETTKTVAQALAPADDGHGCEGLTRALETCPNELACTRLKEQLAANGCRPKCPCIDAMVTFLPVGSYCGTSGLGGSEVLLACRYTGGQLVKTCELVVDPMWSTVPIDPEICQACREEAGVVCSDTP